MEAFLQLISSGKINIKNLISHRYDITEAETAYSLISGGAKESFMGVVLNYTECDTAATSTETSRVTTATRSANADRTKIGFIGAGNFATGVLLPNIAAIKTYKPKAIMSGSGVSAASSAERFGFEKAVSSFTEILGDEEVGTIFIANRHNQHATLVMEALSRGKATFVEKPLCMNRTELEQIIKTYESADAPLMVGFNRRFAPVIQRIKERLKDVRFPLSMHYRINAGFIRSATWIQDPESGGGRVIGEVCHFVDLLSYIADSRPVKVSAEPLSIPGERYRNDDNLQITIRFENGSVGTVNYIASGNTLVSKEYLEIFGGGIAITMDDFKVLSIADDKGIKIDKKRGQDKGHHNMLEAWSQTLQNGTPSPIAFRQLVDSTSATLAILESLSKGEAQWITV